MIVSIAPLPANIPSSLGQRESKPSSHPIGGRACFLLCCCSFVALVVVVVALVVRLFVVRLSLLFVCRFCLFVCLSLFSCRSFVCLSLLWVVLAAVVVVIMRLSLLLLLV